MAYFSDIETDISFYGDYTGTSEIKDGSEITYDESSKTVTSLYLSVYAVNDNKEGELVMPTYVDNTNLIAFDVTEFNIDDNLGNCIDISKLTIEFPSEYENVNLDGIYLLSKYIADNIDPVMGSVNDLTIDVIIKNNKAVITESDIYTASDFISEHVINLYTDAPATSNIVTFSGGSVSRLTPLTYIKKIRSQKMSDGTYLKVSEWTAAESVELKNGKTVEEAISELTSDNNDSFTQKIEELKAADDSFTQQIEELKAADDIFTQQIEELTSRASDTDSDITDIEQRLADLEYVPIAITSFSSSVGTVEIGSVVNDVVLKWALNKTPATLTLDGAELDVDLRTMTLSDLAMTTTSTKKGWTIKATDERNATSSKSVSVTFMNGVYYGVAGDVEKYDSAFILALTKNLQSSRAKTFTVTAGEEQYIYYCVPTKYGACNFNVGGFDGGFALIDTISFTNALGHTEDYYIYKSDNVNLGTTTVKVG